MMSMKRRVPGVMAWPVARDYLGVRKAFLGTEVVTFKWQPEG